MACFPERKRFVWILITKVRFSFIKPFPCSARRWLVRLTQPIEQMSAFHTKLFLSALRLFHNFVAVEEKAKRTDFLA